MRNKKSRPTHLIAERAYLMFTWIDPYERFDGSTTPLFEGASIDLTTQITEARRYGLTELHNAGQASLWTASDTLETSALPANIYQAPTNTMVKAAKLKLIYGARWDRESQTNIWGPMHTKVTQAERNAITTRKSDRISRRDRPDPLQAFVKSEESKLAPRVKNAPLLYIASEYTLWRRKFGVFTSYEKAVETAPETATILEVPADGHTGPQQAKLIRGKFQGGWGYAAGYEPTGSLALRR